MRFYDLDVDDATLYHMMLNTGLLGVERCVALIKAGIQEQTLAAGAWGAAEEEKHLTGLEDLSGGVGR